MEHSATTATAVKSKPKATGNSFRDAFDLLLLLGRPARLVHGIVYESLVGWRSHAWVEDHKYCYDFVDGVGLVQISKTRYYDEWKVKTGRGEIFSYSQQDAINKSIRRRKYYFSNLPCNQ
jgi:hypothetical protein